MAAPDPRLGLGATIEFLTSGIEIKVTKADWDALKRTTHDKTHLGTPAASPSSMVNVQKFPGKLVDGGNIKFSGYYSGPVLELIVSKEERVRVTFPLEDNETTPETFEFDGFCDDVKPWNLDPDEKVINDVNLVIAGNLTYDPAA